MSYGGNYSALLLWIDAWSSSYGAENYTIIQTGSQNKTPGLNFFFHACTLIIT